MGKLADVPPGSATEKTVLSRRVAVFNVGGKLYGIEGDCKHMKASLHKGLVKDRILTCPWHGWRYRLDTGECLTIDKFRLMTYQIEVESGDVYLVLT